MYNSFHSLMTLNRSDVGGRAWFLFKFRYELEFLNNKYFINTSTFTSVTKLKLHKKVIHNDPYQYNRFENILLIWIRDSKITLVINKCSDYHYY